MFVPSESSARMVPAFAHAIRNGGVRGGAPHIGFVGTVDGVRVTGAFRINAARVVSLHAPWETPEVRALMWRWFLTFR